MVKQLLFKNGLGCGWISQDVADCNDVAHVNVIPKRNVKMTLIYLRNFILPTFITSTSNCFASFLIFFQKLIKTTIRF